MLHFLGIAIAQYSGVEIDMQVAAWGQVAITATQLMTHYANDYFDLEADRQNMTPTRWSGGSRILVENRLPARVALVSALVLAGIAIIANLILSIAIRSDAKIFALLLLAQLLAWFYSAPPLRLHSRGLGELTVMIVVPFLTPLTGYYLQSGAIDWLPVLAVVPLCCFQVAMLLAIEFPDAEGDRQVGKKTLVIRLGAGTAARIAVAVIGLVYLMLPVLVFAGLPPGIGLAIFLLSPLAYWQIRRMMLSDWQHPERRNSLAFHSIVLMMASAVAEVLAFVWLIVG